jgi:hypothetical protein
MHRHGATITASWRRSANAHGYVVEVLLSNRIRLSTTLPATQRAVSLTSTGPELGASMAVTPLGPGATPGVRATARLAPVARPGRVKGVAAKATKRGIALSWTGAPRAASYLLRATITGTRSPLIAFTRFNRLVLRPLQPGQTATISITGVSKAGKLGAGAKIRYSQPRRRRGHP